MRKRALARLARWWASMRTAISASRRRRIDAQLNGLIGKLRGAGDFAGKLGDTLLLPAPAGAAAARVLLIGLGTRAAFGRKQYRKALQSTRPGARQDRRERCNRVPWLWSRLPSSTCSTARASSRKFSASQLYKIPDLKTAPKPKAPRLSGVSVAVADARASKAAAEGCASARRSAAGWRSRAIWPICRRTCAPRPIWARVRRHLAKDFPSIKTKVLDVERHQGAQDGRIPRSDPRLGPAPAPDRLRISRRRARTRRRSA